jgi:hypothetical protein
MEASGETSLLRGNKSCNGKRARERSNLTWEESVMREIKDWSITKERTILQLSG